jgi:hypothetical protein
MTLITSIKGIQEAQRDNIQDIAELKPSSAMGRMIEQVTAELHRYAITITHVLTGALRASHRMEIQNGGLRGRIYIDESSMRPGPVGVFPSEYGVWENERGGSHAFYDRTVDERLELAFSRAARGFTSRIN